MNVSCEQVLAKEPRAESRPKNKMPHKTTELQPVSNKLRNIWGYLQSGVEPGDPIPHLILVPRCPMANQCSRIGISSD